MKSIKENSIIKNLPFGKVVRLIGLKISSSQTQSIRETPIADFLLIVIGIVACITLFIMPILEQKGFIVMNADFLLIVIGIVACITLFIMPILEQKGFIVMNAEQVKFLIIFGAAVSVFIVVYVYIQVSITQVYNRHKLKKELVESLKNEDLSWNDVKLIAEFREVFLDSGLLFILKFILRSELIKPNKDMLLVEKIKKLINTCKQKIPFENVPEKISKNLLNLETLTSKPLVLELVGNIQLLVIDKTKEIEKHRRHTLIGMSAGLLSLFLTIYLAL